ncbi:MAG: SpoIVB peptidase [Candidatus Gastranaerophilaceae bacterium]|jgi:stage IV sporulation protein B|nr:SpoIVB peptidase [Christensenellales bacterium]
MKKTKLCLLKTFGIVICAIICLYNYGPQMERLRSMPNEIYIRDGDIQNDILNIDAPFYVQGTDEIQASQSGDESLGTNSSYEDGSTIGTITIDFFNLIPLKTIDVKERRDILVMPGGNSVGIHINTKGVLVVGMGEVITESGSINPAYEAGVRAGDVISRVNGIEIEDAEHLSQVCNEVTGPLVLSIVRDGGNLEFTIQPAYDVGDKVYKLGMWIRDNSAGVGTMTFSLPETGRYGALGHAITDVDTGSIITTGGGKLLNSRIVGITKGAKGIPGELKGTFSTSGDGIGVIDANCEFGVFGTLDNVEANPLYPNGILLGYPEEARTGRAAILTTIDGNGIAEYECEIIKIYDQSDPATKGMVIKVTDERLLEATGGIVQGMSGSPIIQNGKLIGVVTHVFINDPTRGYALYSYWMYNAMN